MGRCIWKWIAGQQRQCPGIVVQEFPDKMKGPGIFRRRGHGGEPDLPVDPRLVGRDERRMTVWIAWFCRELVLLPLGVTRDQQIVCSFENDFVAFAPNRTEGTVGIYKVE